MKLPFAAQIVFVVFSIANGKSTSYFTKEMENASEGEILHEVCRDSPPPRRNYGTKAAASVAGLHRKLPVGRPKLPIDIEKLPIQAPTKRHILHLFERFGAGEPFGAAQVVSTVGIKDRASRNLIALMREHRLVSDVKGCGKGKVQFVTSSSPT